MKILDYFITNNSKADCNLSQDQIHEILSVYRRREAIRVISRTDKTTIGRLADEISDAENSGRQSVYVALYQNHLQVLAKYEVVEYNKERGLVGKGKNIYVLEKVMQDVKERIS